MTISQMRRSVPRSWPKPRPETWGVSSTFSMPQSGEEGGERLGIAHIEHRAAQMAVRKDGGELSGRKRVPRPTLTSGASCFMRAQARLGKQACGARRIRQAADDDVRLRQQLVELRDAAHLVKIRQRLPCRAAHADVHRAEATQALCDIAAEVARAEDEHGAAVERALRADRPPYRLLLLLAVGREVAVHREDAAENVLRDRAAERARSVGQRDALRKACPARVNIRACPCHLHPPQLFRLLHEGERRLADADLRVAERSCVLVERDVESVAEARQQLRPRLFAVLRADDHLCLHALTS